VGAEVPGPPSWSEIADWYDSLIRDRSGPHDLAVATTLRLVPDLRDASVLDLACGQGLAARALARAGARSVTGVDLTPELIEAARRYEAADPLGIRYLVADAHALHELSSAEFDIVTCQLALMDIPDLAAALTAVARVLRPRGAFVFVIGHPCFLAPFASTVAAPNGTPGRLISSYLAERFWRSGNPDGVRRVGNHHRTISTYLNALTRSGLALDVVDEPPADGLLAELEPVYSAVPIFLAARAIKPR
jgi:ubiquinone/menaquinone biosynthesis C-methylase UbiE